MVGVDETSAVFTLEADTGAPVSVPMLNQLGSSSGRGSDTPATVSEHSVFAIVAAD